MVVLHHTAMQTSAAAMARLCDPRAEVSAHYLIAESGEIVRLVSETRRAWHAGTGRWGQVRDVNSHSIGIELANSGPLAGFPPFSAAQMDALDELLSTILARWQIPPERVIAHSDMAPARKADPGPKFDWQRLARQGLSVWPANPRPVSPDPALFRAACTSIGYDPEASPETLLAAFRLRFLPGTTGALDGQSMARACDLAARFPVDPNLGRP